MSTQSYKMMNIYCKRNEDSDASLYRYYTRKVNDSILAGVAFYFTDEQKAQIIANPKEIATMGTYSNSRPRRYRQCEIFIIKPRNIMSTDNDESIEKDIVLPLNTIKEYINSWADSTYKVPSAENNGGVVSDTWKNQVNEHLLRRHYDPIADILTELYYTNVISISNDIRRIQDRGEINPRRLFDNQVSIFYKQITNYKKVECAFTPICDDRTTEDGRLFVYVRNRQWEQGTFCEDCSRVEISSDPYDHDWIYVEGHGAICYSCRDHYSSCDSCDEYIYEDDTHSYNDEIYCLGCYENLDFSTDFINNYSYSPELSFYDLIDNDIRVVKRSALDKSKVPFFGIELEVECNDSDMGYYAEEISHYGGYPEKFFYCKEDGSLSNGFEICFMPMTFNAIKKLDLYEAIFKYRGTSKLQSYNTSTCGIHIHINREAFSDHHLFKFISFIHEYKSLVYLISQRKNVKELNSYSRFNNGYKDRAKREMVSSIRRKKADYKDRQRVPKKGSSAIYGDKYVPVNLQHTNTIEVRVFKGNLLEESFLKNVEFVDSLYHYTKSRPIYQLKVKDYLDFIYRDHKIYKNLNQFLDKQSTKLKEVVNFPLTVPEGLEY